MANRPTEQEVQDHVSEYYANIRYRNFGLKYHQHVIRGLMDGAAGRVLDVGCGTGIISDLYPDLDIVGTDISPGMLRFNKRKNYIEAPVEKLPFENEAFDFVVCRSLLHHLPDCEAGLKEIKRVLKPGGKFVCWETNKSWLAELIRRRTQHGDHFSDYHHSFDSLPNTVRNYFKITSIKYEGYVAYPLLGFPDICNFSRLVGAFWRPLLLADEILSHIPLINKLGFAIRIKSVKE